MNAPVLIERREGSVLVLSNNNPGARNALSLELYEAMFAALSQARTDPSIGAIVWTGEGGHFCAGGDLNQLAKRREQPPEQRRANLDALHELVRLVRDHPKPIIAAVEGAAAGAGLSLALACDLLVAAENAVFSVAYVKVGLTPDGGATAFLAESLSRQRLTELCLTGARVDGRRMDAWGVVNRLTPAGQALTVALELAAQLAQGPEQAMARIKALCRAAPQASLEAQLDREAEFMVEAQATEESREGIAAFLEKRPSDFQKLRGVTEDRAQV